MLYKEVFLVFIVLLSTSKTYANFDFIKNQDLKKEIEFVDEFLDESDKIKTINNNNIFIYVSFTQRFDMTFNLLISFSTKLHSSFSLNKSGVITKSYVSDETFTYHVNNNKTYIFEGFDERFLRISKSNKSIFSKDFQLLDYEFFKEDYDNNAFFNLQYHVEESLKITLESVFIFDISKFIVLRHGYDIEETYILPNLDKPDSTDL